MSHPRHLRIEEFTYELPEERIARYPMQQRDASKLLVYRSGHISERVFSGLPEEIPAGTLLVYNQTRVVHARLLFRKPTGGVVEVFCLEPDDRYTDVQTAMQQQGHVYWKCLVGGASKWKPGMVLDMQDADGDLQLSASVADRSQGAFVVHLRWNKEHLSFAEVLFRIGRVPLPPYLHREVEASDRSRYQTIFAREEGSVAAPTAALHFTEEVLEGLKKKGVHTAHVTLHVGAGTFMPVKSETMGGHEMHAEWIDVERALLDQLTDHLDKGIVAVGTTSMRTLESLYWIGRKLATGGHYVPGEIAVQQWDPYETGSEEISAADALCALRRYMEQNGLSRLSTRTRIIIAPGYTPRIVKGLLTNFHQPQSTLLLLVAAMIGADWKKVYDYALAHEFRFLSYGDSSLLWSRHS